MLLTPYYLIALALVGVANTLYLSIVVYLGIGPSCLIEGCETVLAHTSSTIFGVPLSYLGLVYYVYFLCLAILLALDPYSFALRLGTLLYAAIGLAASAMFVYIQGSIIGAWCQYCLISAVLTLLLFAVALWHFRTARPI